MSFQLWLVRHGETEWTASGQHTGKTDLPLTLEGKLHARQIAGFLNGRRFNLVLTSPLRRATETCRLAGYSEHAIVDANLLEWDYGDYEGRTTAQIQKTRTSWLLWKDGVPNGESIEQVATRAQNVSSSTRQLWRRSAVRTRPYLTHSHGLLARFATGGRPALRTRYRVGQHLGI